MKLFKAIFFSYPWPHNSCSKSIPLPFGDAGVGVTGHQYEELVQVLAHMLFFLNDPQYITLEQIFIYVLFMNI
jgi:hypothetical protein